MFVYAFSSEIWNGYLNVLSSDGEEVLSDVRVLYDPTVQGGADRDSEVLYCRVMCIC